MIITSTPEADELGSHYSFFGSYSFSILSFNFFPRPNFFRFYYNQWFFSDSIVIYLDQIEAEVKNEDNEEEVNFEVNWRNDFEELE